MPTICAMAPRPIPLDSSSAALTVTLALAFVAHVVDGQLVVPAAISLIAPATSPPMAVVESGTGRVGGSTVVASQSRH
jgi:hypothetical protein